MLIVLIIAELAGGGRRAEVELKLCNNTNISALVEVWIPDLLVDSLAWWPLFCTPHILTKFFILKIQCMCNSYYEMFIVVNYSWSLCLPTKWCLPWDHWCLSDLLWRATKWLTWCRRHCSTSWSTGLKDGKQSIVSFWLIIVVLVVWNLPWSGFKL